jgi:hypothetical protein
MGRSSNFGKYKIFIISCKLIIQKAIKLKIIDLKDSLETIYLRRFYFDTNSNYKYKFIYYNLENNR